jgi:hypothetical protein
VNGTNDAAYDAAYGAEPDYTAAAVLTDRLTRYDVLHAYGTGVWHDDDYAATDASAVALRNRFLRVYWRGHAAGLDVNGPQYSRGFTEYATEARRAGIRGDMRSVDYFTACAAYYVARATGDDMRPTPEERRKARGR